MENFCAYHPVCGDFVLYEQSAMWWVAPRIKRLTTTVKFWFWIGAFWYLDWIVFRTWEFDFDLTICNTLIKLQLITQIIKMDHYNYNHVTGINHKIISIHYPNLPKEIAVWLWMVQMWTMEPLLQTQTQWQSSQHISR